MRRQRLIDALDASSDTPLVVVRGPAGSGKTSLLADWSRISGTPDDRRWVTLDRVHEDLGAFWAAVIDGLGGTTRGIAGYAAAATRLGGADRPLSVILDDFHLANREIAEDVARFARLLQRGRVIVLTRGTPAIDSPVQTALVEIATIGVEHLFFTPAEIEELLRPGAQDSDSVMPEAESLYALTGGHPLLTRLAISTKARTAIDIAGLAADWASELVRPEIFEPVLRLALLPVVDPMLAATATDGSSGIELLAELERDGLGALSPQGQFAFHGVIGSALRERANALLPEDVQNGIRAASAARLRTIPAHSLTVFNLLADARRLDELWRHFAGSFRDSVPDALTLDALPSSALASDGMAATIAAVIQSSRETTPSIGLLNTVDAALDEIARRPSPGGAEQAAFQELAVLALLWSARRYEEASERADRLLELTRKLDPTGDSVVWPAVYWGLLYSTVMMTLTGALDRAEHLLDALESDRDPQRVERRAIQRAFIHAMRGEVAAAARLAEAERTTIDESPEWSARLAITRAAIQIEHGRASESRETLRSIEGRLAGVLEWPYAIIVTSRTHLATDPVAGIEDVDRLMRAHGDRPISRGVRDLLHSAIADLALAARDFHRAKALVAHREDRDVALRLTAARIALIMPDDETVDDLRRLTRQEDVWPRLRAQALLLLSVHLHRRGADEESHDSLRRALAITAGHDIRLIHSLIPRSELESIAAAAALSLPPNVNSSNPLEAQLASVALTSREAILLRHLVTSATLKDIAAAEYVTLSTIKSQAASLYRKLGVGSREEAVETARRRGILDLASDDGKPKRRNRRG